MSTASKKSEFSHELYNKVRDYFNKNQIARKGGPLIMSKAIFVFVMLLSSYTGLMLLGPINILWLSLFFFLTLFFQLVGSFAVMHDASHNALSHKIWLDKCIAHLFLGMGGVSASIWRQKHVVSHHMHTNTFKQDSDIDGGFLFVFSPYQKQHKLHRKQHLYAIFFYGLLTLKWIIYDDIHDLVTNVYHLKRKQWFRCLYDIILTRLGYIILSIVIPSLVFGSFFHVILAWIVYNMLFSLCLTLVFQCAHVNTKAKFYSGTEENPPDFATQQLLSTTNYATNNPVLTWMLGGLNFQVIHHLFPTVNHRHYPAIQKILTEVVQQYPSLQYNQFPTLLSAIKNHFVFLKQITRQSATPVA